MSSVFGSSAFRALLLALLLAGAAAFLAPAARGATPEPSAAVFAVAPAVVAFPAEGDWSWSQFIKFWQRQAGTLTGVVGTVMLIALVAVLIILSKGRG